MKLESSITKTTFLVIAGLILAGTILLFVAASQCWLPTPTCQEKSEVP